MTDKKNEEEMNVWVFPEVSTQNSDDDDDDEFSEEFHSDINDIKAPTHPAAEPTGDSKEDEAAAELAALKAFYEKKIISVSKIIAKLNDTKPMIDKEIFQHIQTVIKKLTKKIIKKEIALDPAIMKEMILDLKSKIKEPAAVVTVQLSKTDFERMENLKPEIAAYFKVQEDLKEGDIIVKCNTSEIHAQLNERIDNLLSDVNE
jgi:flagellar biosynthesis/type III secretory pathway protein FliH